MARKPKVLSDRPAIFKEAVSLLEDYANGGKTLRTGNFAVAVAVLMHRHVPGERRSGPEAKIYSPGTGELISTKKLQLEVCDITYTKDTAFLPPRSRGPVYKLFSNSFKPPSPKTNNWRNCFDLQAGLGCDAPYDSDFLRSREYLAEDRLDCAYRNGSTGKCLSPAGVSSENRTCFNPSKRGKPPGADSMANKCPKLLSRGLSHSGEVGYWVIEPTRDVLIELLGNAGNRVPLFPFLVALYSGSPYFKKWGSTINRQRLQRDLMIDSLNFSILFDPDPGSPYNHEILTSRGARRTITFNDKPSLPVRHGLKPTESLSTPVSFSPGRDLKKFRARAEMASDPAQRLRLLERASRAHVQALDALGTQLKLAGLRPTEQPDGYDMHVQVGMVGHLFEVKTWQVENLKMQIRHGLAQLYEYRWRNRSSLPSEVKLYLVLHREPPGGAESWLWKFLFEDRGVVPCWIKNGRLTTFPQYASRLNWLLS